MLLNGGVEVRMAPACVICGGRPGGDTGRPDANGDGPVLLALLPRASGDLANGDLAFGDDTDLGDLATGGEAVLC